MLFGMKYYLFLCSTINHCIVQIWNSHIIIIFMISFFYSGQIVLSKQCRECLCIYNKGKCSRKVSRSKLWCLHYNGLCTAVLRGNFSYPNSNNWEKFYLYFTRHAGPATDNIYSTALTTNWLIFFVTPSLCGVWQHTPISEPMASTWYQSSQLKSKLGNSWLK
mgnify:CR=1 FL=1